MSTQNVQSDGSGIDGRTPSRYDLLLAALPIPLLAGVVGSTLLGVDPALGVGAGSIPSLALLGYGLFVGAPTVDPVPDAEATGSYGLDGVTPGDAAPGDD